MTNEMIILWESVKLMEQGLLGTTGRTFTVTAEDGSERVLQEPEAIHTFSHWKELGFSVKKGEHALAKFPIWKGVEQAVKDDEGNATEPTRKTRLFMKTSAFFSAAQVEPMTEEQKAWAAKPKADRKRKNDRKASGVLPVKPASYGSWLEEA